MKKTTLKDAIHRTLDKLKTQKLSADIVATNSKTTKLSSESCELGDFSVSSGMILGLRLIDQNGRVGVASSESIEETSLDNMIEAARQAALISEADLNQRIESDTERVVDFWDTTNEKSYRPEVVEMQEKINLALDLERKLVQKDKRIKNSPYNSFNEGESEVIYANTLGAYCCQKRRSYQYYTSGLFESDSKQAMHMKGGFARTYGEINLQEIIDSITFHGSNLLEGKPVKSGSYDVIFDMDILHSLFSAFSNMLSGKAVLMKTNPFVDKLGAKVACDEFTLIDDPFYLNGQSDLLFDDEGFKRKQMTLINNGTLENFYHNSATAKALGVTNNFCAQRSPKGHLNIGGTNTLIKKGSHTHDELKSGTYLEIIQLQGLHSGVNAVSGDFSVGASGYLKEGDKTISPVKGITISGNFYQLLQELQLGDTLFSDSSQTFFSPTIRFKNLSVGGD